MSRFFEVRDVEEGDRCDTRQLRLFSNMVTASDVIREAEVRRVDAGRLHDAGLLRFDPRAERALDEGEAAELRFLCTLLRAGCDVAMVRELVASLPRPYDYDVSSLVYDFAHRRWRVLVQPEPLALARTAIEDASNEDDVATLGDIGRLCIEALASRAEAFRERAEGEDDDL